MGTGGSRFEVGRPGWRRNCAHLLALDVRVLARRGRLSSGMYYSGDGLAAANPQGISVFTLPAITCDWFTRARPRIPILNKLTAQCGSSERLVTSGGSRPWFRCPRCWALCAVIYGVASDGRFGCRQCMRLAYASEAESRIDRINHSSTSSEQDSMRTGRNPSGCDGGHSIGFASSSRLRTRTGD